MSLFDELRAFANRVGSSELISALRSTPPQWHRIAEILETIARDPRYRDEALRLNEQVLSQNFAESLDDLNGHDPNLGSGLNL